MALTFSGGNSDMLFVNRLLELANVYLLPALSLNEEKRIAFVFIDLGQKDA